MKLRTFALLVSTLAFASCHDHDDGPAGPTGGGGPGGGNAGPPLTALAGLDALDLGATGDDIVLLDGQGLSPILTDVFERYTALTSPSGERIHLFAQAGVSDAELIRAREVLRMQLADVEGSTQGADKSDVRDAVASRSGTLALFDSAAGFDPSVEPLASFDADFGEAYVPLFGDQIIVEGTPEYLAASPAYDQTFGAAAVLTHRLGLSTERSDWFGRMQDARLAAEVRGDFAPTGSAPYRDLDEAYIAVLAESHAGVWAHDPSGDGSAQAGAYAFGSRAALAQGDPVALGLFEELFPADHAFDAVVDPDFTGTFDLLYRPTTPYSNRARYLRRVRLSGSNFAEIFGSSANDVLVGNAANNNFRGRSGDDVIDGGPGLDSAIFLRSQSEFTILDNGDGSLTVRHDAGTLGTNIVRNCEYLVFSDGQINL